MHVVAADLWISAGYLHDRFAGNGCRHQIIPLHMDVTRELPFAEGYFDAIFCMNSFNPGRSLFVLTARKI